MGEQLPVPILDKPHWRVNLHPEVHEPELLSTLSDCYKTIEKTRVRLRGWDFPHLSQEPDERGLGQNYAASWCEIFGHHEYWRMYQSGQFLFLATIRERQEQQWHEKIKTNLQASLQHMNLDWDSVPGFIETVNFIYSVTEIFEFSARLCRHGLYRGNVFHRIDLRRVSGFLLGAGDPTRFWHRYCRCDADQIGREWVVGSEALTVDSAASARDAIIWFFERFTWLEPNVEYIRTVQDRFLSGKR